MDQVDHDVRRQLAFAGHAVDQVDLVVALVHQRCPGALVIGTQLRSAFSKTRATTRPASSTMLAVTNFVSALRAGGASAGALRRPRLRSGVRGTGARSRRNRRCYPFALRLRSLEWRAADLGWILAEALQVSSHGPFGGVTPLPHGHLRQSRCTRYCHPLAAASRTWPPLRPCAQASDLLTRVTMRAGETPRTVLPVGW